MEKRTLIQDKNNGQYWRVTKKTDIYPVSPREEGCNDNIGKMLCWSHRHDLGDQHEFESSKAFLADLLFKLAFPEPYYGNPVYRFITAGKAEHLRFDAVNGKRVLLVKKYELQQTKASIKKTEAALSELNAMLADESKKTEHPYHVSMAFIHSLVMKFGFTAADIMNNAYSLFTANFVGDKAWQAFAAWLREDIGSRYKEVEPVGVWKNDDDENKFLNESGVYPDWFLDACIERLSESEMVQILTGDMLSKELVILPLYLYDHSGISMSTSSAYPYNDRWDAKQVGWIYATRENYANAIDTTPGLDWRDACTAELVSEVKAYDDFLTGKAYVVSIERFVCPKGEAVTKEELAEMAKEHLDGDDYYEMADSRAGYCGDDDATNGIDEFIAEVVGEYETVA